MKTVLNAQEQDLYDVHNQEISAFFKKNKRYPTIKDEEFWAISERYKQGHQILIDIRKEKERIAYDELVKTDPAKAELMERPPGAKRVQGNSAPKIGRVCVERGCNESVERTGSRGRPPIKCEIHRKVLKKSK